jgi:hypothetical protein
MMDFLPTVLLIERHRRRCRPTCEDTREKVESLLEIPASNRNLIGLTLTHAEARIGH